MISKFLEDFGLESEFSTHSLMRGLSGGQKVKVVLAAAMWLNPHMLILVRTRARPLVVVVRRCAREPASEPHPPLPHANQDEPTNYLDRDSLGALAGAIREYGGGVLMITHNSEFSGACP